MRKFVILAGLVLASATTLAQTKPTAPPKAPSNRVVDGDVPRSPIAPVRDFRPQACDSTPSEATGFSECDEMKLTAIVQQEVPLRQQIDAIEAEAARYIQQLLAFYGKDYVYERSDCGQVQGACHVVGRIVRRPPPPTSAAEATPKPATTTTPKE